MHAQRPRLTITEAASQFEVSRSTVKRGLSTGRYPGAEQATNGAWRIPVEALHAEHRARRSTVENVSQATNQPNEPVSQGHDLGQRIAELEHALAVEQVERRAAERIAEIEGKRADSAERALLMLEAAPRSTAAPEAQQTTEPEPEPGVEPLGRRLRRVFRPRG